MSLLSKSLLAALAALTLLVYGAAIWILIAWIIRLIRRRPAPKRSRIRAVLRAAALVLAVAGIGCAIYAWKIEPGWIEVTQVSLNSSKVPASAGRVRIVHISDLHCEAKSRLEDEIAERIAQAEPDLIVFTGDALNSPDGLPTFRSLMKRLVRTAPTFGVKGNWDEHSKDNVFADTGVVELTGRAVHANVRGARIALTGAGVRHPADYRRLTAGVDKDEYVVMLFHYPDEAINASRQGVDLYLAGHTHGGQIALPGYGALITLSKHGKRFESGLSHVDSTAVYVNRGLGMEGHWAPRMRFCARPEITVIDVWPSGQ